MRQKQAMAAATAAVESSRRKKASNGQKMSTRCGVKKVMIESLRTFFKNRGSKSGLKHHAKTLKLSKRQKTKFDIEKEPSGSEYNVITKWENDVLGFPPCYSKKGNRNKVAIVTNLVIRPA